ncbi:MAG: hypothetical protein P8J79_06255 [Halioglobus sp.]|nr:hypothetical protein [Halioglobus sp.]
MAKFIHLAMIGLKHTVFRLVLIWLILLLTACASFQPGYFKIYFIDDQTGRGIPLVEIKSTNSVSYVSDSAGLIAMRAGDLDAESLYFSVYSHGYELQEELSGFQGIRVKPTAGEIEVVPLRRINIAERLYRVTGEGIYHDSRLVGLAPALGHSGELSGGVFGQDSVVNAIYKGQLYWFWGDTRRADGPLGNFEVSGAVSRLPQAGNNIADDSIQLTYFVDSDGNARGMCPIEGAGPVWISGLMVFEEDGQEQMFTYYSRVENVETKLEQGIAVWNDEREIFEKRVEFPLNTPLYPRGQTLKIRHADQDWFYFGRTFPDVRVRAAKEHILDSKRYEAFTCLKAGSRWRDDTPPLERNQRGQLVCSWKADTDLITEKRWRTLIEKGLVKPEEQRWRLVDSKTGDQITPHNGSVAWNQHRNRWILIFGQLFGRSLLGEVWYAEALSPVGPWSAARKIVTHNSYSFYNVKQHPYFANGRYLYFEGTYSSWLSGNNESTPRYDYNQIMYRLDLNDPRLPRLLQSNSQVERAPLVTEEG